MSKTLSASERLDRTKTLIREIDGFKDYIRNEVEVGISDNKAAFKYLQDAFETYLRLRIEQMDKDRRSR